LQIESEWATGLGPVHSIRKLINFDCALSLSCCNLIRAIVLLTMLGGTGEKLKWSKETKARVGTIPGVKEVYGVLGRCDLVALVEAEDMEKLTSLVADEIRGVPGIQSSETMTIVF
jgi:DNA-binding Lrp family transcriptional regulator